MSELAEEDVLTMTNNIKDYYQIDDEGPRATGVRLDWVALPELYLVW